MKDPVLKSSSKTMSFSRCCHCLFGKSMKYIYKVIKIINEVSNVGGWENQYREINCIIGYNE